MKLINKTLLFSVFSATILSSCGGGAPFLTTPVENIDTSPMKEAKLTEVEAHNWGHLDLAKDTIPGMSVDKAYSEIIKGKRGQKIIVAVIDTGIDAKHPDLDGVMWTNKKEIAGNGKDDDNNGYIDDIHGWNFLGDAYDEQLEKTRLVASGNTSAPRFAEAKADLEKEIAQMTPTKTRYEQIYAALVEADKDFTTHFKTADYTNDQVKKLQTTNEKLAKHKQVAAQMNGFGISSIQEGKKELKGALDGLVERLNTNYNVNFKGRTTGDNPDDFNDKPGYGNGNIMPSKKDEAHGTHVAGIIAAERNNGLGANGVANNVEIMSIRAVPGGDEYDKDIAKGIRYAVDNGAKVINGSFGKYYSPHSDWVRDAIAYAGKKGVIFVNAAGNEGLNIDDKAVYPNDQVNNGPEVSSTFITVGALAPKYGTNMVAGFSNYGKINVDVFAPGAQIYSTTPENDYKTFGGTSMAAPAVAGVCALVWSQYPKLTAAQVKQIIMDSGLAINTKVVVGGKADDVRDFRTLTKSGKMVNAYNALIMASQLSK